MKKLFAAMLSIIMAGTTFLAFPNSAIANTINNAPVITLSKSESVKINPSTSALTNKSYYLKFVAPDTQYYEFICSSVPAKGSAYSYIVPANSKENCHSGYGIGNKSNTDFIVAGKLQKGRTYYIYIRGEDCGEFSTTVSVSRHTHTLANTYTYPASYDSKNKSLCFDGGIWQPCKYCSVAKTIERYYRPIGITLSVSTCYYRGHSLVPKITIKDREGNVIHCSNYTVNMKNNLYPGKATVTVTLNGDKYSGKLTSSFNIIPSAMGKPKLSSTKSKQLNVNWIRNGNVDGYYVQYSTSPKFTNDTTKGVFIKKYTIGSTSITKLKGGRKYYVRMRAFKTIDGKNHHGAYSEASQITVKK